MQNATRKVEAIIEERIENGIISDASQARKTIAGNGYQGLITYSLIKAQQQGLLNPDLVFTLKPKNNTIIEKYATIKVGDEIQKPDIDLLVYNNQEPLESPITIYSIKTSLRERAGQTYRWKLLMDIALAEDCQSIKDKYDIDCQAMKNFKVGFITADFYNEVNNPQQQGMMKFFDYAYVTKPIESTATVSSMSYIIDDLNSLYH